MPIYTNMHEDWIQVAAFDPAGVLSSSLDQLARDELRLEHVSASSESKVVSLVEERSRRRESIDVVILDSHGKKGAMTAGLATGRAVRALPDALELRHGIRANRVPLVLLGRDFSTREVEVDGLKARGGPVLLCPPADRAALKRQIMAAVRGFRHDLLDDMHALGFAVARSATGGLEVFSAMSVDPAGARGLWGTGGPQAPGYERLHLLSSAYWGAELSIELFRDLINRRDIREVDLQRFFEQHPEFLLRADYDSYWSEPRLSISPEQREWMYKDTSATDHIRPDLVLQPQGGRQSRDRWKIVELKMPDAPVLSSSAFHTSLSHAVQKGIEQLSDYGEYFRDSGSATEIRRVFGNDVRPRFPKQALLIGATASRVDRLGELRARHASVEILTYDDVLEWRERDFNSVLQIHGIRRTR